MIKRHYNEGLGVEKSVGKARRWMINAMLSALGKTELGEKDLEQ